MCVYFAYYRTSRFSNIYLKEMFLIFLVARPIFIVGYTTATAIFNINATYYMTTTIRNEKIGAAKKKNKKTTKS